MAENVTRSVGVPASNMTSYQVNLTELLAGCEYAVAVLAIQATETDTEDSSAVIKNGYTGVSLYCPSVCVWRHA